MKISTMAIAASLVAVVAVTPNAPTATAAQSTPPAVAQASSSGITYHSETEGLKPLLRQQTEIVLAEGNGHIQVSGGVGGLGGRRTPEQQQKLIDDYANHVPGSAPADPLDKAKHVTGDAVDLEAHGDADVKLRAELTAQNGLCQTHKNEAWHYELCTGV